MREKVSFFCTCVDRSTMSRTIEDIEAEIDLVKENDPYWTTNKESWVLLTSLIREKNKLTNSQGKIIDC